MTKLKTKSELLPEAKKYFSKYPNEKEIHTIGDGNFFFNSNLSAAKTHAKHNKVAKLITIERDEVEDASDDDKEVQIPEGDPNKDWTKEELIAYGKREFEDLKLTKNMKEDTILDKLAEAEAKAKDQE